MSRSNEDRINWPAAFSIVGIAFAFAWMISSIASTDADTIRARNEKFQPAK